VARSRHTNPGLNKPVLGSCALWMFKVWEVVLARREKLCMQGAGGKTGATSAEEERIAEGQWRCGDQ
jgi:hypothetical protein